MKRYALIILVLTVLLINSLMKQAAEANPLTDIDLWELRFALPAGVSTAALCLVCAGVGAMFWRGALPLCGAEWAPEAYLKRLTTAALWCGWLPLLCARTYTAGATQLALGAPSRLLLGAFVGIILCRMLSDLAPKWRAANALNTAAAVAAALICGHEFCPAVPLCPLVIGLAAAPALRLLTARETPPQMVWLLVAALAFCAYTAAFGHLLSWYTPGETEGATPRGMWIGCAYLALTLLMVALPALRRCVTARRVAALAAVALCIVWAALQSAPMQGILPAQQAASVGICAAALALLGIPAAMLTYKKHSQQ